MADARSIIVLDATGAPLTSGTPGVSAYDLAGTPRTAPTVAHVAAAPGTWRVEPTDADEAAGTVVLVDFGAGNMAGPGGRYAVFAVFKADNSNQFFAVVVTNPDGTLWTGTAPTVGGYTGEPLTLVPVPPASTSLFVAVPSEDDVADGAEGRIDGPAGSAQPYWSIDTQPLVESGGGDVEPSPGVMPDMLAVKSLQDYLRRWLPMKVPQLNGLRASMMESALAGPFTIPSGAVLRLSSVSQTATPTSVSLTAGSRTAAQVAAEINTAAPPGLTASADSWGRLVLTAAAPTVGAPSCVVVQRDVGPTGANALFGWDEGGEHFEVTALTSPKWRGVVDGRPRTAPDMNQGFWVMLLRRTSRPLKPGPRLDQFVVTVQTEVWRPISANAVPSRSNEAISSCVRAVRELLLSTDGRYLGRQGANDIQLADVSEASISAEPVGFKDIPGVLFDIAQLTITVRVYQRTSV